MLTNFKKSLNSALLKVKPSRKDFDLFKNNIVKLIDSFNKLESEEHHKSLLTDFLRETYYKQEYPINTKDRIDLVINNGVSKKSSAGVLIETKRPSNKAEMPSKNSLNSKALQELVLYFLRERIKENNLEVKHLIITNNNDFYIFDAKNFESNFAHDKKLVAQFEEFEQKQLSGTDTSFFYSEIASPKIIELEKEDKLDYVYFKLSDYEKYLKNPSEENDKELIPLYKIFSPEHLLKLSFSNDSNTLDKSFYNELLHIIGLTETSEGGKKLIQRSKKGERHTGSLIENSINQLDMMDKIARIPDAKQYGDNMQDRLFNVSLELAITWINRILFLKLLEAQIISYHKGEVGNIDYAFLNLEKIPNYDALNMLFFQVLARKYEDRSEDTQKEFANVPYLNSSLFEPTVLEHNANSIANLNSNKTISIYSATVLKDKQGKKKSGEITPLAYLFEFLNSYDFSSEGTMDIQEDNKTLINASVLGLIFEKINGYKDGSFFTPGFITMYMCRETLRKAVLQKFKDVKGWDCKDFDSLYNKIDDIKEANAIVNSLKICDPAVGSGHFLVSALNEIVAIKNDLNLLQDKDGRRLKEYEVEVINDELVVRDEDHKLFEYKYKSKESQRVQETLFHEKQTIIENCLFGVDINPNSVKICRLRLWIELLKNAYYIMDNSDSFPTLQTLPNIDINIKTGNSLISRFDLDADMSKALKKSKWSIDSYKIAVDTYRNAENKEQKWEMEKLIKDIKTDFRSEIQGNDPKLKRLYNVKGDIEKMVTESSMFEKSKKEQGIWDKKMKKLTAEAKKLEEEIEDIKSNKIYENAFEWRFEFPEVLNDDGDFIGFDIVIGNPPYIGAIALAKDIRKALSDSENYTTLVQKWDIYIAFVEKSIRLLKNGITCMIIPYPVTNQTYAKKLRDFIVNENNLLEITDLSGSKIFEEATVTNCILFIENNTSANQNIQLSKLINGKISVVDNILKSSLVATENTTIWNLSKNKSLSFTGDKYKNIGDYCFISIGMVLNADEKKAKGLFVKKELLSNVETDINNRKYIEAKHIEKYKIKKTLFLEWGTQRVPSLIRRPTFPELYERPKLLVSKIGKIKATFDDSNICCDQTIRILVLWHDLQNVKNKSIDNSVKRYQKDSRLTLEKNSLEVDLKFMLALINSKLANFLLDQIRGIGNIDINPEYLKRIPIPKASKEEQAPFISLVEEILALKSADPKADTSKQEAEIDRLVYELYGLSESEINIIENN